MQLIEEVRLGGDAEPLDARAERLVAAARPAELVATVDGERERTLWEDAAELRWAGEAVVVRVPLVARQAVPVDDAVREAGGAVRLRNAVNVARVAWPGGVPLARLDAVLREHGLGGQVLAGVSETRALIGAQVGGVFAARVRQALDPHGRCLEV